MSVRNSGKIIEALKLVKADRITKQVSITGMEQFRRLFGYIKPYRKRFILALVIVTLGSIVGLAGPYTLQYLIDAVLNQNDPVLLNKITLLLIGIFFLQSVLYFGRAYLLAFIGERVMADMRIQLFDHLQGLSLSFYNERHTGELMSRLTNDVSTVRNLLTSDVSTALSQGLTFIGAMILIIVTDWRLTLFMFLLVPLVIYIALLFGRRLRKISSSVQDQLANATTVMEEVIAGMRVVQSFARERYESGRYRENVELTFGLALKRIRISSVFGPVVSFLGFTAVILIFWFGGHQVLNGQLTTGQLFMFLVLTMTIAGSIGQFSGLWTGLQEALGATGRLFEILDTQSEIVELPDAKPIEYKRGEILFNDVTFAYLDNPETKILNNISLEICPGEILALVGPSGAGKTTLVNLIPRFFDPVSGTVSIDGQDIRSVQILSLRDKIGIVPQETLLFGGTVRDNIVYGKLDASEEEIIEAAQMANAHEFITQLPQGYETIVGERGVKLSGGQRQRLAIARAILKDPRILLLDEATSSLDSESEGLVQEALQRLMKGRTSLVIAHRLSTIQNADQIAVLDEGRLVEKGTHTELLELNGIYAHLYRLQFKTEESDLTKEVKINEPEGLKEIKPRRRSMRLFNNI